MHSPSLIDWVHAPNILTVECWGHAWQFRRMQIKREKMNVIEKIFEPTEKQRNRERSEKVESFLRHKRNKRDLKKAGKLETLRPRAARGQLIGDTQRKPPKIEIIDDILCGPATLDQARNQIMSNRKLGPWGHGGRK